MKRIIAGLAFSLAASVSTPLLAQGATSYQQFEECVAVTSWLMQGKDTSDIENKKRVKIPDG